MTNNNVKQGSYDGAYLAYLRSHGLDEREFMNQVNAKQEAK